jgi:hypothetical protein
VHACAICLGGGLRYQAGLCLRRGKRPFHIEHRLQPGPPGQLRVDVGQTCTVVTPS